MKSSIALVLAAISMSSLVHAGTVSSFGVPSWTQGTFLGCANPAKMTLVSRNSGATVVQQIGPQGVNWRVDLPPMKTTYDQYFASTDGDSVVVMTSPSEGRASLVVQGKEVPITDGFVADVDYQAGRVLVVTNMISKAGPPAGVRFRIFDVSTGMLVGDHQEARPIERTVDRDFVSRLSFDGKAFFYVLAEQRGVPASLMVRSVSSGIQRKLEPDPIRGGELEGEIIDIRMDSQRRGYLVTTGGLFTWVEDRVSKVATTGDIGDVRRIAYIGHSQLHAVIGSHGWGVRSWLTGQWIASDKGSGVDVHPAFGGWVAIDRSQGSSRVTYYQYGGERVRVARELASPVIAQRNFVCANAYGAMINGPNGLEWEPTVSKP